MALLVGGCSGVGSRPGAAPEPTAPGSRQPPPTTSAAAQTGSSELPRPATAGPVGAPTERAQATRPSPAVPGLPASGPRQDLAGAGQDTSRALELLAALAVKGRAPSTGYSRQEFGQAWADVDRNGCDTRNDILRRDLTGVVLKRGTSGCKVLDGHRADPYSGQDVPFGRLQVDHVVALANAWQTGAAEWPPAKRLAFANDPLNLLSVSGSLNAAKGDGDAATWLPPAKAYRCAYVARQVAAKSKYGLWVTAAERDAAARVLAACPSELAPTSTAPTLAPQTGPRPPAPPPAQPVPLPVSPTAGPPAAAPRKSSAAPVAPAAGTDPRYSSCRKAKADNYGPYRQGIDREYDWYIDRDADGVVCE